MNNEVDGSKKINEGRHELCHAKGHPYFILPY